jgi:hypothetical protein
MSVELGGRVVRGEVCNTSWYNTDGWLQVRGVKHPVRLDLTGNCGPDLAGCRIRFEVPDAEEEDGPDDRPSPRFATEQVGPTGVITARRGVYLEWFGQNGRVVVDLPHAVVELLERVELKPPPGIGELPPEPESSDDDEEEDEDEEPHLLPETLEHQFEEDAEAINRAIRGEEERPARRESADEDVREMELMDALIESGPGEPLVELFEGPLRLPRPEALDDAGVEMALKSLLAQLAVFNVALSVCPHYSIRDAYKLMLERICPNEHAYSELRGTGWIQHFMTHESCPLCEAEADREYEEMERKRQERGDEPPTNEWDEEPPDDEDIPF